MYITIYTNPNCYQCEQTKRFFDIKEIPYKVVDITQDQEGYNCGVSLGFKSVPVVSTKEDVWSGFRLDKLNDAVIEYNALKDPEAEEKAEQDNG